MPDGFDHRLLLGVNHWPHACETYERNHPHTQVECADLQHTAPERYRGVAATDILLGAAECRKHSLAQGKQRTNAKQLRMFYSCDYDAEAVRSRATLWEIQHFLATYRYRYVVLENVVEARYWDEFDAWLTAMRTTEPGYQHELLYLNSMFFGAPQSWDRLYMVFWRKDMPAPDLRFEPQAFCWSCQETAAAVQCWKNPRKCYGKYGRFGQYVYHCPHCNREVVPPFLPALVALDWSLPSLRIGDRSKPLATKTMERLQVGLAKWRRQQAFLFNLSYDGDRTSSLWQAAPTQTARADRALVSVPSVPQNAAAQEARQEAIVPQIVEFRQHMSTRSICEALSTVTADGEHHGLLTPPAWLAKQYSGVTALHAVDQEPAGSITTIDHHSLITPSTLSTLSTPSTPVKPLVGDSDHRRRVVLPVLPSRASLPAWLVPYYGSARTVHDVAREPSGTFTADDCFGLLSTAARGGIQPLDLADCGFRMLAPTEIQLMMSFAASYQVLGSRREQIRQLGNAVTPPVARWIVERILEAMVGRPRTFDPAVSIWQAWQDYLRAAA